MIIAENFVIYLTGIDSNLENLIVLAKTVNVDREIDSFESLKGALLDYLKQYQPQAVLDTLPNTILEIRDENSIQVFHKIYSEKSELNDLNQESLINIESKWDYDDINSDKLWAALDHFKQMDLQIFDMLNLVFNYFFFARSDRAAGGSTSSGIGILWVNPSKKWKLQDYMEFIVHEITHQLLFYDERRYSHYRGYDEIKKKENFAYSTILKKSRPLDKVIHSLFVGINILLFREKLFGFDSKPIVHPESKEIVKNINRTIESLRGLNTNLLCPRVWDLIDLSGSHIKRWNNHFIKEVS